MSLAVVSCCAAVAARGAFAQEEDDDGPALRPGLVARYTGSDGEQFSRRDGAILFHWRARRPDPRLPIGPFSVAWQGRLLTMAPGEYTLYVHAAGDVKLRLDGRRLLDVKAADTGWFRAGPIDLEYGYHPLEVSYRAAGDRSRIGLYWTGPRFRLEPVAERHLFHEAGHAPDERFDSGRLLSRALRCAACHQLGGEPPATAAPSLTRLAGNLSRRWLIDLLQGAGGRGAGNRGGEEGAPVDPKRMPDFAFTADEVSAIADVLLASSPAPEESPRQAPEHSIKPPAGDAHLGGKLFHTLGCLACHPMGQSGGSVLFGGGDLSAVAQKRPADFFARWLESPSDSNSAHRMPRFELTSEERAHLAAFLATRHAGEPATAAAFQPTSQPATQSRFELGRRLLDEHRCAACHELPHELAIPRVERIPMTAETQWGASCLAGPDRMNHRPGYFLSPSRGLELRAYVASLAPAADAKSFDKSVGGDFDGRMVLAERNCLGCHARGLEPGISARLDAAVSAHPELAGILAELSPPPLTAVGDKLRDEALGDAVRLKTPPLRPWLAVRMPKFNLADDELQALVDYLVEVDRIPDPPMESTGPVRGDGPHQRGGPADDVTLALVGGRLVTSEGFGCTSCHQIGKSVPVGVAPAAHGADLSLIGRRVRPAWFDRWVRNPARIVPRMEMPSIQVPVRGVLAERLDDQLAAVWRALNTPGFSPPPPGAIRVLRTSNVAAASEHAVALTDVLEIDERPFVVPLVVGLANRHNVLFDLDSNRLAGWWMGDTARQRARGKSWSWEPGGRHVVPVAPDGAGELRWFHDGASRLPARSGQFTAQLDWIEHTELGLQFGYRVQFDRGNGAEALTVSIVQRFTALEGDEKTSGFHRRVEVRGVPPGDELHLRLMGGGAFTVAADGRAAVALASPGEPRIRLIAPPRASLLGGSPAGEPLDGPTVAMRTPSADGPVVVEAEYLVRIPGDRFPPPPREDESEAPVSLAAVPGYEAVRLPLPSAEMPTGLAWRDDGTLAYCSLKGSVWLVRDTDGDGIEDRQSLFCDGLAAPYGIAARGGSLDGSFDIATKPCLMRLSDRDGDGWAERADVVASGWGYTADYHDWTIGLPSDDRGAYYLGLPCQQDERGAAAAYLRGTVVKLVPREATVENPRGYTVEPLAAGLRFPMGLALNRSGDLFVTDNQGNYTPFNELNQIVAGARYGFINRNEAKPGFAPPFREPAIDIPHPWTRSVNGICFLGDGPFAGHLIGCEFDTRRLIRMSLQRVNDGFQGAAYPFSIEPEEGRETFEGPVVCAVSPAGDIYVGNLRDSGWGGGHDTGSIVRLREAGGLPPGIAEVRAVRGGFTIDFTRPVDRKAAADATHYTISSYRRVATSAYGGPDVDREAERIESVEVAPGARRVTLRLARMRPGFVYEFHLGRLVPPGEVFFPAEAHYTLRNAP